MTSLIPRYVRIPTRTVPGSTAGFTRADLVHGTPTLADLQTYTAGGHPPPLLVTPVDLQAYGTLWVDDEAEAHNLPVNHAASEYAQHVLGFGITLRGPAVLTGPPDVDDAGVTAPTPLPDLALEVLAALDVEVLPAGRVKLDDLDVLEPSLGGGLTVDAWVVDLGADEHWLAVCPVCGYTELLDDPEAARSEPCPGGGEDDRGRDYPCRTVGRLLVIGLNTATRADEYPRWRTLRGA